MDIKGETYMRQIKRISLKHTIRLIGILTIVVMIIMAVYIAGKRNGMKIIDFVDELDEPTKMESDELEGPYSRTIQPKDQLKELQQQNQMYAEKLKEIIGYYPEVMKLDRNTEMFRKVESLPPANLPQCTQMRKDVIYIKLHKCGSDTTTNIVQRFGLRNNLSFMLPVRGRMTLAFPYLLEEHSYRPFLKEAPKGTPYNPATNGGKFNIICEHATYQKEFMRKHTKPQAPLFTTIREPFARLKSAFNFFGMHRRSHMFRGIQNGFRLYLSNITKYERAQTSTDNYEFRKSCLPFKYSFTDNGMSFGLGLQSGFYMGTVNQFGNNVEIAKWLDKIEKEFDLVMLLEYYHESLILLRRLMCWDLLDILYIRRNTRDYKEKKEEFNPEHVENFKYLNRAEYALYHRFNQTLWLRIEQEEEFDDELAYFDDVISTVADYCQHADGLLIKEKGKPDKFPEGQRPRALIIDAHKWNKKVVHLQPEYCSKMSKRIYDDLTDIYQEYPGGKKGPPDFVPGC